MSGQSSAVPDSRVVEPLSPLPLVCNSRAQILSTWYSGQTMPDRRREQITLENTILQGHMQTAELLLQSAGYITQAPMAYKVITNTRKLLF
jgi:hypothetical protein